MEDYYKVEWETYNPFLDDGISIGADIHSEIIIYGLERAKRLFIEKIKDDSCHACFVTLINDSEEPELILSYCP